MARSAEVEFPDAPPGSDGDENLHAVTDSDMANAARLAKRHGDRIRFTNEGGFLVFDGRRWTEDRKGVRVQSLAKETVLAIFDELSTKDSGEQKAIFQHARRSQARNAIEAMTSLVRSEPGILANLVDFDADPYQLNVANGTLTLQGSVTLRPHNRADRITKISEVVYDPRASCELWDGFLWRVTAQDEELYGYLRRLIGYCLTGCTTEQALHFWIGLGANGKTVASEILLELLGEYGIVASPDLIMTKRHGGIPNDVARLRGARAVLMNETTQGGRFDEAKLKDLTGSDRLCGRFMREEFFDFKPTHKLLIRGNHKPAITGTDEGIWRRLRLIPFNVQIPPQEQDPRLGEKLRAELSGILNWALEGCLEWQRTGLNPPAIVLEAVSKYREESDILGRFISESCEERKLSQVKSSALFKRYQTFFEQAGERCIPSKDLPAEMERRGFTYKRSTGGVRIYLGIELRSETTDWGPE